MTQRILLILIALLLAGTIQHVQHYKSVFPAFDLEEHVKPFGDSKEDDFKFTFFTEFDTGEKESYLLVALFNLCMLASLLAGKRFLLAVFYQSSYFGQHRFHPKDN
ncbi:MULTISPECIES: hypothetical protein [Bacillaceae]|uniref:hypothetical protein n=1 Tax=Bacillaceae TaxID=186817 RepID=UPI000C7678A4|nr:MULTISPECIES: hypothetical protein [Bacillaceae]PLR69878.1 hypothetical protein CYJ36_05505 [Bacillus sp. UMB0893]QNG58646.1 hypothetical protein H4O14_12445 [Bacillus sp. PAMC26568]